MAKSFKLTNADRLDIIQRLLRYRGRLYQDREVIIQNHGMGKYKTAERGRLAQIHADYERTGQLIEVISTPCNE